LLRENKKRAKDEEGNNAHFLISRSVKEEKPDGTGYCIPEGKGE
jgi:hypothetical protein